MDDLLENLITEEQISARSTGVNGVLVGTVTNNKDEAGLGRVKVTYSWRTHPNESKWVRIATLYGGSEKGTYFVPEEGDEVLLAFEKGDITRPFVIGALWNEEEPPPSNNEDEKNNIKIIKSRSGHSVIFDDEENKEKLEIHSKEGSKILFDDASGNERILITDKNNNLIEFISSENTVKIISQNTLSIKAKNIELKADSAISLEAGSDLSIKAGGTAEIKGAIVNIN